MHSPPLIAHEIFKLENLSFNFHFTDITDPIVHIKKIWITYNRMEWIHSPDATVYK